LEESIRTIEDGLWSWVSVGLVVYLIMVVKLVVDEVHAPFRHVNHKFFKCTPTLEKPLNQYNQKGEMVVLDKRINVKIREKGASTSPLVLLMHTY